MGYRPWGELEWVLSLSDPKKWFFVGTIGTEERSLCARRLLCELNILNEELLALINDNDSEKYREKAKAVITYRIDEYLVAGGNSENVVKFSILEELFRIQNFAKQACGHCSSLILDITSFPKRFYFPMLKEFVKNDKIENLVITYTTPKAYCNDEPLYEDSEAWKYLPGFIGNGEKDEEWVVSVGFLIESLRRFLGDNPNKRMKVLIPFPAPLSILRRTWGSVYELEKDQPVNRFENIRVDTLDMSEAFDRISSIISEANKPAAFAPFGPKPISAAMCLYAINKNCPVYYPQPTIYNPEYSIGIRHDDPKCAVNAYWVKLDGESLYKAD